MLPPFWSLVEAHGDELLVHARRLTGDAAEDVLQDALLRALRAYPKLRHAEHLRAWLYRVTTTTAIDHHRRVRREVLVDEPPVVASYDTHDDDDFEGGGTYFLPKSARWGTVSNGGRQTFKLPGRPVNSQIVVEFYVFEYPASWYAPAPIN